MSRLRFWLVAATAVSFAFALTAAGRAGEPPIVNRHVLGNGMTVLIRESRVARVVAVSLQVRGELADEEPAGAGITNFTQRVMVRGTACRTAAELTALAEDLERGLDAAGDVDYAEIRGHALSRHWRELLDLVADIALTPAFPTDEVDRTRRLILGQIQTRADTPRAFAMDAIMRELYGHHPYALPTAGDHDTITPITRDALLAHHRRLYRPERLVLAVSGDVPGDRVRRHFERLFAKRSRTGVAGSSAVTAPAASGVRRVLGRPRSRRRLSSAISARDSWMPTTRPSR
jgi:zinc protease